MCVGKQKKQPRRLISSINGTAFRADRERTRAYSVPRFKADVHFACTWLLSAVAAAADVVAVPVAAGAVWTIN